MFGSPRLGKKMFLSILAASVAFCGPLFNPGARASSTTGKPAAASANRDIVAVAGKNIVVTRQALESAIARYKEQSGKQELTKAETAGLLEDLIRRQLLLQLPAVNAYRKDPAVIAAVKNFEDTQVVARWASEKMRSKAQVSEQEIKAYYDGNRQEFRTPPGVKASYILLRTRGDAEMVQKRLGEGADFARLAKQYSIDLPTGRRGGLIGTISEGKTPTELGKMLFLLAQGETSGIIRTRAGYAIFKADEIIPPAFKPYIDVRDDVREKLLKMKTRDAFKQIVEDIEKKAGIKIFKDRLADIEHSSGNAPAPAVQKTARQTAVK